MASIRKRGDSYLIRASVGYDVHGNQVRPSMTWKIPEGMSAAKAEKEAKRQAVLFEESCKKGFVATAMKFETFLDQWFDEYAKNKIKASTFDTYRWASRRVRKEMGYMRLDKITTRDVQGLVNYLNQAERDDGREGRLSAKSVRHHFALVQVVCEYAVTMQYIAKNPCTGVTLPRKNTKEREICSLEEMNHFLSLLPKAGEDNFQLTVFLILAASTGCRRAELLGLEWPDFTEGMSSMSIRRTANYSKELGYYTDTPKTKSSFRTVELPDEIAGMLMAYKDKQRAYAESLGDKWQATDRLFTSWNGSPMYTNAPERLMRRVCKKNDLKPIPLHSFRHFNASLLINAGLDVKTVSAHLGHSVPTTTLNIYTHEFQRAQSRVKDTAGSLLDLKSENLQDKVQTGYPRK
jgi:integrase